MGLNIDETNVLYANLYIVMYTSYLSITYLLWFRVEMLSFILDFVPNNDVWGSL